MIQKFMIFERKILRRIFGRTKEKDRTWRIKTNEELDYLRLRERAPKYTASFVLPLTVFCQARLR